MISKVIMGSAADEVFIHFFFLVHLLNYLNIKGFVEIYSSLMMAPPFFKFFLLGITKGPSPNYFEIRLKINRLNSAEIG